MKIIQIERRPLPIGYQAFVLEFKMVKGGNNMKRKVKKGLEEAITQTRAKGYAKKYRDLVQPIHLIGMVFGEEDRNLLDIRVEMF